MNMQIHNTGDMPKFTSVDEQRPIFASMAAVDKQVQAALAQGKNIMETVRSISAEPTLPPAQATPDKKSLEHCLQTLPPSTAGAVFALINEVANKQRQMSAEQRYATTEEIIRELNTQADKIHSKAVSQLVCGIMNGVISIGVGIACASLTVKGMGKVESLQRAGDALGAQQKMTFVNNRSMLLNQVSGGLQSALGGASQRLVGMYDEELKRSDAQVERRRALNEALHEVEESLKQVIQKSLQAAEAIQQSTNQARQKILG